MEGNYQSTIDQLIDPKTYVPSDVAGILPRTALFIQQEIDRYHKQFRKKISIEVSALEIYCDDIRDLLSEKSNLVEMKNVGNKVQIPGQKWVKIQNPKQFLHQIEVSRSKRVFKNNGINETSSRSHHVF